MSRAYLVSGATFLGSVLVHPAEALLQQSGKELIRLVTGGDNQDAVGAEHVVGLFDHVDLQAALGTRDGPGRRVQEKRGQDKKSQQKGAQ